MDEELKLKMRTILLELFGLDINNAVFKFSTQNYAFILKDSPYMIRVSITPKKTRSEVISELMWVDDLKQFKDTICEPNPSKAGRIIEEFTIDGILYRASMFKTARGKVQAVVDMTPMFFICVGDLLGGIHMVSTNEQINGIHYKRKSLKESIDGLKKRNYAKLDSKLTNLIDIICDKVDALPHDIGHYGICHGDFHGQNFFVESNNIWVFDFDSCCYTHYLFDIACFLVSCLSGGFKHGKAIDAILDEDIMPYFKIGYELNQHCDEHYYDNLKLFMYYRVVLIVLSLSEIKICGIYNRLEEARQRYVKILMQYSE